MQNITYTPSAPHSATWVVPTAARSAHVVSAMWSKQLPIAPAAAVKANRNKGAMGAPGFWDPV